MNEEIEVSIEMAKDGMQNAITHLERELTKIRAGKATPSMLDRVMVEYYGNNTPINQVANVNTLDARTLTVQPWEKDMLDPVVKAILNAGLGLNPQNNGEMVIINVPALTEERRKELVKQAKSAGENAKVSIRNNRRETNEAIKKLEKDGLSEDEAKGAEDEVQSITNEYTEKIDKLVEAKEKDILTV